MEIPRKRTSGGIGWRSSHHASDVSIDIIRRATSSTLAPLDRSDLRDARPFYEGRHREELLAEYGIETTQKQLQPLLPLRVLNDQLCPDCGAPLQQKWATKTYGVPQAFYKPCGHQRSAFAPDPAAPSQPTDGKSSLLGPRHGRRTQRRRSGPLQLDDKLRTN